MRRNTERVNSGAVALTLTDPERFWRPPPHRTTPHRTANPLHFISRFHYNLLTAPRSWLSWRADKYSCIGELTCPLLTLGPRWQNTLHQLLFLHLFIAYKDERSALGVETAVFCWQLCKQHDLRPGFLSTQFCDWIWVIQITGLYFVLGRPDFTSLFLLEIKQDKFCSKDTLSTS